MQPHAQSVPPPDSLRSIPAGVTGPFLDYSDPGAPPRVPQMARPGPGRAPPEECQPHLPLPSREFRR